MSLQIQVSWKQLKLHIFIDKIRHVCNRIFHSKHTFVQVWFEMYENCRFIELCRIFNLVVWKLKIFKDLLSRMVGILKELKVHHIINKSIQRKKKKTSIKFLVSIMASLILSVYRWIVVKAKWANFYSYFPSPLYIKNAIKYKTVDFFDIKKTK